MIAKSIIARSLRVFVAVMAPSALVGCGGDDASTSTAIEESAQEHFDSFKEKMTVGANGKVHVDERPVLTTTNGTVEGALRSVAGQTPIICGGDQDYGGRLCCTSTRCCFNIRGKIHCF
jgi:hypothetical protein